MASVDVSALSKQQKDELACSYAAMLLHDGELEISVSNSLEFASFDLAQRETTVVCEHANLTCCCVGGED